MVDVSGGKDGVGGGPVGEEVLNDLLLSQLFGVASIQRPTQTDRAEGSRVDLVLQELASVSLSSDGVVVDGGGNLSDFILDATRTSNINQQLGGGDRVITEGTSCDGGPLSTSGDVEVVDVLDVMGKTNAAPVEGGEGSKTSEGMRGTEGVAPLMTGTSLNEETHGGEVGPIIDAHNLHSIVENGGFDSRSLGRVGASEELSSVSQHLCVQKERGGGKEGGDGKEHRSKNLSSFFSLFEVGEKIKRLISQKGSTSFILVLYIIGYYL